jgi:CubicO group peptidase (beta-lactamase class C family)
MADSHLVLPAPARSRLATGYDLRRGGPRPVADYEVITAGGAAAYSTPRDIARYLAALLGSGGNEHGSVLEPETLATLFASQFQPDPRIPGLGLAFFRGGAGGHRFVEHQGVVPAFTSQVFLAPDDGLGVLALTNGTRNGMFWLPVETERLLRRLLGTPDEAIRTDVPQRPEIWGDLCGWYAMPGPVTDVRARGMIGAGFRVVVRRGELFMRCLSPVPALLRGMRLHPDEADDPYVFRAELPGAEALLKVVFAAEPGRPATAVHLDLMPLTAYRLGAGRHLSQP